MPPERDTNGQLLDAAYDIGTMVGLSEFNNMCLYLGAFNSSTRHWYVDDIHGATVMQSLAFAGTGKKKYLNLSLFLDT